MIRPTRRHWSGVLVALVSCLATYGVVTIVQAEASSTTTTFYACLKSGLLSNVSTSPHSCAKGYAKVTWNAAGTQGATGTRGTDWFTG